MSAVLLAQLVTTLILVGLIWNVQAVHYPLFKWVDGARFSGFHADHSRRISWIVVPLMLLEAGGALWLVFAPPHGVPIWAAWLGLSLVGLVWLATAFLSVPQHRKLKGGFDPGANVSLVVTNWVRTLAWTARGGLLVWLVSGA